VVLLSCKGNQVYSYGIAAYIYLIIKGTNESQQTIVLSSFKGNHIQGRIHGGEGGGRTRRAPPKHFSRLPPLGAIFLSGPPLVWNPGSAPDIYILLRNHYVIKFVSDLRWIGWISPVTSTNKTNRKDITGTLLKVALNTITLTLTLYIKEIKCVPLESLLTSV
jgi:hypothetical protein